MAITATFNPLNIFRRLRLVDPPERIFWTADGCCVAVGVDRVVRRDLVGEVTTWQIAALDGQYHIGVSRRITSTSTSLATATSLSEARRQLADLAAKLTDGAAAPKSSWIFWLVVAFAFWMFWRSLAASPITPSAAVATTSPSPSSASLMQGAPIPISPLIAAPGGVSLPGEQGDEIAMLPECDADPSELDAAEAAASSK